MQCDCPRPRPVLASRLALPVLACPSQCLSRNSILSFRRPTPPGACSRCVTCLSWEELRRLSGDERPAAKKMSPGKSKCLSWEPGKRELPVLGRSHVPVLRKRHACPGKIVHACPNSVRHGDCGFLAPVDRILLLASSELFRCRGVFLST